MDCVTVERHPLNVRPLGDQLLSEAPDLRPRLGLIAMLPDEILLRILGEVGGSSLCACACTSMAMRVLASSEDVWRTCCLEAPRIGKRLRVHKDGWRCTYHMQQAEEVQHVVQQQAHHAAAASTPAAFRGCAYYSDVLFSPWHCGTAAIPHCWSRYESIARVNASELSVDDFCSRYERCGQPVILTGLVEDWPAFSEWSEDRLRARFGNNAGFHVGGHTMGLCDFFDYCLHTRDEQPLYLFDREFAATSAAASTQSTSEDPPHARQGSVVDNGQVDNGGGAAKRGLAAEYRIPEYFAASRDLFEYMPAPYRPDYRWLIAGGVRSGSSWHVDPNATCAWNACVVGQKKWILTPPGKPPPGVTASDDGASVTSPISLYEWFRVFYSSLVDMRRSVAVGSLALEATVRAGEILFIPQGWWHCCLNLQPSIAVTQNFAPRSYAREVLHYLRAGDKAGDLVSGVPSSLRADMASVFEAVLREHHPEALRDATSDSAASLKDVDDSSRSRRSCSSSLFTRCSVRENGQMVQQTSPTGGAENFFFSF